MLAAVYFGIAFVLIADYGEPFSELQLFTNSNPLPNELAVGCELNRHESRAAIYTSTGALTNEQMRKLADALDIQTDIMEVESGFMAVDQSRTLNIYSDGTWEYADTSVEPGDVPAESESVLLAIAFLNNISGSNARVISASDTKVLTGESLLKPFEEYSGITKELYAQMQAEAQKPIAVDIYLLSSIDGFKISGSNEITATVGRGGKIAAIKVFDPDLKVKAKKKIISQAEAYEKLISGEGAFTLFTKAESAIFNSCELVYMLNSAQGYYLPVWSFNATAKLEDGSTQQFEAYVPALK